MTNDAVQEAAHIRVLEPQAAATLVPRLAEILIDAVDGGASVGYLPPLASEDAAAYWQDIVASLEPYGRLLLVAELAGRVVGTVQLVLEKRPNGAHRAEIAKLLVHREARRRGVGAALMRAAEQLARQHDRTTLVLDTLQGHSAEQLYAQLGWQRAGVIPSYAIIEDGSKQPTVYMYKLLE